jgi:RHS repeat-associated protein
LWRVRDGFGTLAEYSYDAVGNRKTIARRNGVGTVYEYDAQNRLQSMAHAKDGVITSSFEYSLNQDGKRAQLREQLTHPQSSAVASVARTIDYGYDAVGRLQNETRQERQNKRDNSIAESTKLYSWTYDNANNRLTQSIQNYTGLGAAATLTGSSATAYSYNVADELYEETTNSYNATGTVTGTSTVGYEYDFNGNQVSKTVGSSTTNYAYSFEDKLLSVTGASTQHAYSYDAGGNRLSQVTTTNGVAKSRFYLVDTNVAYAQVVEERDENGVLQASYTTTDNGELISGSWRNDAGEFDTRYYLQDGHASARQLADTTGGISDVYSFDGWGNSVEDIGESANDFLYNGQQKDDTGLYHLRARQYDSGNGRFINHDPLMGSEDVPTSLHRYQYASNDPVNLVDPSGRFAESLIGVLAGLSTRMLLHQREIAIAEFGIGFIAGFKLQGKSAEAFDFAQMVSTPLTGAGGVSAVGGRRIGSSLRMMLRHSTAHASALLKAGDDIAEDASKRVALGVGEWLREFADEKQARHFLDDGEKWMDNFLEALYDDAQKIFVNLTGPDGKMIDVWEAISHGRHGVKSRKATDWELFELWQRGKDTGGEFYKRVKFYHNGAEVENPFS